MKKILLTVLGVIASIVLVIAITLAIVPDKKYTYKVLHAHIDYNVLTETTVDIEIYSEEHKEDDGKIYDEFHYVTKTEWDYYIYYKEKDTK